MLVYFEGKKFSFGTKKKYHQKSVCPLQRMQPKHECLFTPQWNSALGGHNHSCCLLHQVSHPSIHPLYHHCLTFISGLHLMTLIITPKLKYPFLQPTILPAPHLHIHHRFYSIKDLQWYYGQVARTLYTSHVAKLFNFLQKYHPSHYVWLCITLYMSLRKTWNLRKNNIVSSIITKYHPKSIWH